MVVTREVLRHFKRHGWVAVNRFWNKEEVQVMRQALDDLHDRGILQNVSTEGDGVTKGVVRNLQVCPLSPEHRVFAALPFQKKVKEAIGALITDDGGKEQNVVQYLSQAFWKPPEKGLGTSWHQDNAYFRIDKATDGVAMWIAIHDATVENGTMHVVDGVNEILPHKRDMFSDHHISCNDSVDESKQVPICLEAGGVAFFHYNVPHCTKPNATNRPRAAIAYHFLNQRSYRERAFPLPDDADWKTPIILGPDCTDGEKEYGQKPSFS